MDIKKIWQQQPPGDDMLNDLLQHNDYKNFDSNLPLKKLKNNLLIGIFSGILISLGYVFLIFKFATWQVNISLIVLIAFNSWIIYDSWKLYRNIEDTVSSTSNLRQELENICSGFQKWWSLQQRSRLFVYPVALTGGFIMGGVLGSGKSVDAFLYNSKMLSILGVTILILVPVCYYLAKWIFRYVYGKYLVDIKQMIKELTIE